MSCSSTMADVLMSTDVKIRRQITYWAATAAIYSGCFVLIWLQVRIGVSDSSHALGLTLYGYSGLLISYLLIRLSKQLKLSPSQLAIFQGCFAISIVVVAYATMGSARGASLTILLVIQMFCAFTLDPRKFRWISAFTIGLLGTTMLWKVNTDPAHFPVLQEVVHFSLAALMLFVSAFLIGQLNQLRTRLKTQKAELADALIRIQMLATRDELTSLANRRHMNDLLADEQRRHRSNGGPVCIALLDIDLFKRTNDTYGHNAGDEVLRKFAERAQSVLRNTDILARWGGEEFLLLLPNTEQQAATLVLDRIKEQIAALRFPDISPELRTSFSCGLVALGDMETMDEAINRADQAMYHAKSTGRDRIVVA